MRINLTGWRKSSHSGQVGDCVEVAAWRKSSHSSSPEGDCVELAAWRKSSHSAPEYDDCIEVADVSSGVAVRDSKDPDGPHLHMTRTAWRALAASVHAGILDRRDG